MKKLSINLFIALLSVFSLNATHFCDDTKNVSDEVFEYLSKSGQSISVHAGHSDAANGIIKDGFDVSEYPGLRSKSKTTSTTSSSITYQYTTDGFLQHVGWYADSAIFTNIEGPRKGAQFILANNGALMDMRNDCKEHKNHFTHKYSWGEVNTYETHQTVIFKN